MAGEIIHWNICGLKTKNNQYYKIKTETLTSFLEKTESTWIMNIQETHISKNEELPNFVKNYEHLFNFITSNAPEDDTFAGLILGIRKTERIISTVILESGRLIWVKVQNEASNQITNIFSIYCKSSNSQKQKQLITKMKEHIIDNNLEDILILGDFNFVTSILDRNNQTLNSIDLETKNVWDPFENENTLQDCFRLTNPKRRLYTFSSRSNQKIKSRIDRIYATPNLSGKILSSQVLQTNASDHKIVKVRMASHIDKGPGLWVFNSNLLKDNEYEEQITGIVNESERDRENFTGDDKFYWDILQQQIMSFTKEFSKERASKNNKSYHEWNKELEYLESLPRSKLTPGIIEKTASLQEKISVFQKNKIKGGLIRSKIPSFEKNEPSISFLNRLEKRKGEANMIYCLYDEETKRLKTSTNEIKEVAYNFYSKLYKSDGVDSVCQQDFINQIDKKISQEDKERLDEDLSEKELYEALKALKDHKSPGLSGLTKEFYLHFWEVIKTPFMRCVKQIIRDWELSEMQKRGAIKINFKKGDRTKIKNYRPITLLNLDLRIISKALAMRLRTVISKLIHPNQTCVPGRNIENNIHIVQNLIDHINETDGEAAMIFLDQEKAFDRMDHSFILKTLRKFGFGENFIGWVKTFCKDTKSVVKINGFETMEFDIERGVRQGCCLSPLLYILTAETLSTHIRKNTNIKGYRYKMKNLEHLEHKTVQYADDMHICITSMPSLKELFRTLNKFEKATNAKINTDKTEALWVGKWMNRTDTPFDLKWTSTTVRFIGIHVGNKVGATGSKQISELNFAEQIEKIKIKIKFWKGKGISLCGRVKVVNIFLLSRLWFRTNALNLYTRQQNTIEVLVKNFIWRDKIGGRVRQGVLNLGFDKGGLQLVDISCKIKTQRIKRIMYLLSVDDDKIERFLADSLIGKNNRFGQTGLSYGIISNLDLINKIKNDFYKSALKTMNSIELHIRPGSIRTIQNEPLFYNKMFLDENGHRFTLTRHKNAMPKKVKDLNTQSHSRESFVRVTFQQLRTAAAKITFSNTQENVYSINIEGSIYDVANLSFKDIYLKILNAKNEVKEWEQKWQNILLGEEIDWKKIWENLHNKIHHPLVQSSNWEMYHLNFWSGYKAKEVCKLCNEQELDTSHIVNKCKVLIEILKIFRLFEKYNNTKILTFGLNTDHYHNYILFHIKSTVFRSRFQTYANPTQAIINIAKKIKLNIKEDIRNHYEIAKYNGDLDTMARTYNLNGQTDILFRIGRLDIEKELIFDF